MSRDPDFVVIGSGPNGLVAACTLAMEGAKVLVLEAHPDRPGGALWSEEATLPGFVHDVGAAFFPFSGASPAFRHLDLARHGLVWKRARWQSCHPAPDGSVATIGTTPEERATSFGSAADGRRWSELAAWHAGVERDLLDLLLRPIPAVRPAVRLFPAGLLRLARMFSTSGRGLATRLFESEAARRVLPGLALHVDIGPDDRFGAGLGYMLGLTATTCGNVAPAGGARVLTEAMLKLLDEHGGTVELGSRVERVIVDGGRARAVRTASGDEIAVRRGVLANTSAPSLFLDLVESGNLPGRVLRAMKGFRWGWGTFKVDWALSGPVPWAIDIARESAVVHAGDSLDDLSRFTREVRAGRLPENPYLVIGQQSLFDRTRAPEGNHTLWAYSRVPPRLPQGWATAGEGFADTMERRIEGLAPGFRERILARRIVAPPDLEKMDANLVGGDLGGGSNAWNRLLVFRPVFPYFRYRTPVRGLYLCSSYAHPGAGVHGMCGFNAAQVALGDSG